MRSAQTRYEQTLRVLNQATLALQQARTREEVHEAAAEEMDQLGYRTFILLLSRDGKHLHIERLAIVPATVARLERLTGLSADSYEIPIELLAGHEEIIEERKAVFVSNLAAMISRALPVSTQPLTEKLAAMLVLRQGVLAPLVMNGRVEGIVIVSADALSEADVPVVTAFADQISAALERARLFAELQEREWRATVALDVAQQYARELTEKVREEQARQREISAMHMVATVSADELATEEVMGRVLAAIRDLFQLDGAAIYFLDDQQRLRLASALGMPESFLANIRAHPPALRDLHGGKTVLSGQPVLVQDLEDLDQPTPARTRRPGVRTIANLPLRARGRLIGVMALGAQRPHALEPDDLTLLTSIATQFATTLENVWLLEREQLRRVELDRLNNALRLFANQLQECRDEPAIAQLLCETVRNALGWNQAIVSLRDVDSMNLHLAAQVGCSPEAVEKRTSILFSLSGDDTWMRDEFRVGHSYYIPDASAMMERQSGQERHKSQGAAELTDLLIIPLEAGGRSLGVLLPVEHEDGQSPTRERIEHLELFAAQAAIAVEAIRLSKSVRMWADAVRHSGDAIVITDLEGMILSVNPAFEDLSGYRQEEVIGQNTRILNSGLTPTEAFAEMWDTVLSGGIWRGEVINQRKDGSVYDADLTAAPILDEEGEIIGLIGSHRDITRIK
jgi:PAS domain S-box-containing protein